MTRDEYGRRLITEKEICDIIYTDPSVDISKIELADPSKHNLAIAKNYSELSVIRRLEQLTVAPTEWHKTNQSNWWMPQEYKDLDIASWLLSRCEGEAELQRCGMELLQYAERGLLSLLCYMKYLVDTLKSNGVVWGVGRGSSVASFVLYKIGIHRINSLEHDLDFTEFMR